MIFFHVMQKKTLNAEENNLMLKKLWKDLVICIPKTNTSRSQNMQINLWLNDSFL